MMRDAADEPGDCFGIEAVVLGHGAACQRELADPQRVEAMRRKPGVEQGPKRLALVTAAGLEPDRCGGEAGQPPDQRRAPGAVVGKAQPFADRPESDIELRLGNIDTGKDVPGGTLIVNHLRSLPCACGVQSPRNRAG